MNGERHWLSIANNTEQDVTKWIGLLRTQNGNSSALRLRKMWHTDQPSIQGPWTPFTHKNPEVNLVVFPDENLSRPMDVGVTATEKLIELFKQQKIRDAEVTNQAGETK